MFNKAEHEFSLSDRQVRHSVAIRIGMVLVSFFSAAWCLLQWTLATEPRFMVEGIARQFVLFEAFACAVLAAVAFVFMVANGLGWIATMVRIRRERNGAARRLAVQRSARRVGAYI